MKFPLLFTLTMLSPTVAMPLVAQGVPAEAAAKPDSATIAAGDRIYHGRGLCATCHGAKGEGLLGPTTRLDAGKEKWLHHDGTLAAIIQVITTGIDAQHSVSHNAMPPRGGSRLSDEQIRQVAAYVMVLHTRKPDPKSQP